MQPTLQPGDRLLANKRIYKKEFPLREDVIVFDYPEDPQRQFVKRLIALGGETVEIRRGDIFVNDQLIEAPSIKNIFYYNLGPYGKVNEKIQVPEGFYYVLGDKQCVQS